MSFTSASAKFRAANFVSRDSRRNSPSSAGFRRSAPHAFSTDTFPPESSRTSSGDNAVSTVSDTARTARNRTPTAEQARSDGAPRLTQLEAATPDGSVFVVCDQDRTIAAATTAEPTVGLVLYDLKSCLRALDADAEQPQPEPRGAA